jgi:uncharacterized OB-fold protein
MREICRRTAVSGEVVGQPCPDCGHVNVVHYRTDACAVCRLEALADDYEQRLQELGSKPA